jgi:hypothetical protein
VIVVGCRASVSRTYADSTQAGDRKSFGIGLASPTGRSRDLSHGRLETVAVDPDRQAVPSDRVSRKSDAAWSTACGPDDWAKP